MASAESVFTLAEGIVLAIQEQGNCLYDVSTGSALAVADDDLPGLEALCSGVAGDGVAQVGTALAEMGLARPGPLQPDAALATRLQALDEAFAGPWLSDLPPAQHRAYAGAATAHSMRKRFYPALGQLPVTPETALRRALCIGEAAAVGRKRVLCLGDDDLVSVPLALLGHEVVVLDVDAVLLRLLASDHMVAAGASVSGRHQDLRDPLDPSLLGAFDCAVTDPMPNRSCFALFLSRALACLRPEGTLHVAVPGAASSLFSAVATEMNVDVLDWHQGFNRYYGVRLLSSPYQSDWVRLQKNDQTRLLHEPQAYAVFSDLYRSPLYPRDCVQHTAVHGADERCMTTFFLSTLFDLVEGESGMALTERRFCSGRWGAAAFARVKGGFFTLCARRAERVVTFTLYPLNTSLWQTARDLVLGIFKEGISWAAGRVAKALWELQLR